MVCCCTTIQSRWMYGIQLPNLPLLTSFWWVWLCPPPWNQVESSEHCRHHLTPHTLKFNHMVNKIGFQQVILYCVGLTVLSTVGPAYGGRRHPIRIADAEAVRETLCGQGEAGHRGGGAAQVPVLGHDHGGGGHRRAGDGEALEVQPELEGKAVTYTGRARMGYMGNTVNLSLNLTTTPPIRDRYQ